MGYFTVTALVAALSIPIIANAALVGCLAATPGGARRRGWCE
jgi:hypothetical protein